MTSTSNFSETTVERYALALYQLAQENSELDRIENETRSIKDLLKENFEFVSLVKDPTYNKNEQLQIIDIISKKFNFSKTFTNFLSLLCFKRRLFFLDRILSFFLKLISKGKGEIQAKLSSSKELSKSEIENIQQELSENFTSKIKLDYKYEPKLIGGLIIQVGSIMIDTSIKNKLKQLQLKMIEV